MPLARTGGTVPGRQLDRRAAQHVTARRHSGAAAASVTRNPRPGAAAKAIAQTGSATCWKSAISPLVSRGSARAWPGTPGSR